MKRVLTVVDAIGITIGIVIGVGIFKTPSLVALHTGHSAIFISVWIMGGICSLIGALCYAEMAAAYPHPGGEYHYLARALGKNVAFLFAWARVTVIQTGSISMLAFILGDYLSQILSLGLYSSSIYASLSVIMLTTINIIGIHEGKWVQNLLTAVTIAGLLCTILAGILCSTYPLQSSSVVPRPSPPIGLAMVFVLLTYGGWNEAAYISAEIKDVQKNMTRSLMWSIGIITVLYVLTNIVYVTTLGMNGLEKTHTVAFDVMYQSAGPQTALFIALLISISALSTINGSIITGARTTYALGREFPLFRIMGTWNERTGTPVHALLLQGIISLLLILFGSVTMSGFVTMVEYTAPVFWLFFFLSAFSLIVLRVKEPLTHRPFRVPFYPFIPLAFCCVCLYMLIASIRYTRTGACAGMAVLAAGIIVLFIANHYQRGGS